MATDTNKFGTNVQNTGSLTMNKNLNLRTEMQWPCSWASDGFFPEGGGNSGIFQVVVKSIFPGSANSDAISFYPTRN